MRIIQLLPTFAAKDAIGNDVVNIHTALTSLGYDSCIYASHIPLPQPGIPCSTDFNYSDFAPDDVVLFHYSIGGRLTDFFASLPSKKILIYHNVTPPAFFEPYNIEAARTCRSGLQQIRTLVGKVDACWADSSWNAQDLREMGFACRIDVVPILIPFDDYRQPNDENLSRALREVKGSKVLFVGRIAPNKCQHDVIRAFACYKRLYDPKAVLYLVGSHIYGDAYFASLLQYVMDLQLDDVYFADSVSFPELLSFYGGADVLLCQSEHEGFCVPVVEAMLFDVPVVAYDACAVKETLGESPLALDSKNPHFVAAIMNTLMENALFREEIIRLQRERLRDFEYDVLVKLIDECIKPYIKE